MNKISLKVHSLFRPRPWVCGMALYIAFVATSSAAVTLLEETFAWGNNPNGRSDDTHSGTLITGPSSSHPELTGVFAEVPNNNTEAWVGSGGGQGNPAWSFSETGALNPSEPSSVFHSAINTGNDTVTTSGTGVDALLPLPSLPAGPDQIYKLSLDVVPPGVSSSGVSLGFSSGGAVATGNAFNAGPGEIWLTLNGGAQFSSVNWSLHTRTGGAIATGSTTLSAFNNLSLTYDPVGHTIQGSVNGASTASFSYTPQGTINAVGFEGNNGATPVTVDNFSLTAVPEPQAYGLVIGLGLVGFSVWNHRRKLARLSH